MGLDQLEEQQDAEAPGNQATDSAPLADSSERNALDLEEAAAPRDPSAFSGLEDEPTAPRGPSAIPPRETPEAEPQWEEEPTAPAARKAPRPQDYKPPEGKRGRKADPRSPRAMRTYVDWKARAVHADERAAVRAFGLAVYEHLRGSGQHAKADTFGKAEGFLLEGRATKAAAPSAPPPQPALPPQAPAATAAGAPPSTAPATEPAAPPPPPPELIHGQPVARVELAMGAILPAVEMFAGIASSFGLNLSQPTERVIFKGRKFERKLSADPVAKIAELLAVESLERAEKKGLVGPESTSKGERRLELLLLMGTTFGPAAVVLGKKALGKLSVGAEAVYRLVKGPRP